MSSTVSIAERASDAAYAAGWKAVRALPEPVARALFEAGADAAARRLDANSQLTRNLARVLGVSPEAVPRFLLRDSMRSYARYWREAFRLPTMGPDAVVAAMEPHVTGQEHLRAGLAAGRGVVVALPHSANWDLGGAWLAAQYGSFATVAERLKPESLYQRFLEYRESLGFIVLPLTGEPGGPFPRLKEHLAANRIVCLMGERDLRRTGVEVDFFGAKTRLPAGPVKLAQETGAPLHYAEFHYRDADVMAVDIHPAIDVNKSVEDATQALADAFAGGIARHPADWHMLQPQWLDDLDPGWRAKIEGTG